GQRIFVRSVNEIVLASASTRGGLGPGTHRGKAVEMASRTCHYLVPADRQKALPATGRGEQSRPDDPIAASRRNQVYRLRQIGPTDARRINFFRLRHLVGSHGRG